MVAFRPEEGAGSQGMRPRLEAGTGEKTGFPWSRQEDMADTPLLGLLTAGAGGGSVSLVRGNCGSSGARSKHHLRGGNPHSHVPSERQPKVWGAHLSKPTCPSCFLPLPRRGDRGPRRYSGPDLGVTLTPPMLPLPTQACWLCHLTPAQ